MTNNFSVQVRIDKEEWVAYPDEQRKSLLNRLGAVNVWISQYIYEALNEFEKQLIKERQISIEKTMQYYYGDEDGKS